MTTTAKATPAPAAEGSSAARQPTSRTGLKHIGGYLDREDVEKIAVLRARLGLDNSQLIRLAVDQLWRKHGRRKS